MICERDAEFADTADAGPNIAHRGRPAVEPAQLFAKSFQAIADGAYERKDRSGPKSLPVELPARQLAEGHGISFRIDRPFVEQIVEYEQMIDRVGRNTRVCVNSPCVRRREEHIPSKRFHPQFSIRRRIRKL